MNKNKKILSIAIEIEKVAYLRVMFGKNLLQVMRDHLDSLIKADLDKKKVDKPTDVV